MEPDYFTSVIRSPYTFENDLDGPNSFGAAYRTNIVRYGMGAQSATTSTASATTDGRIAEFQLWAVREGLRRAPAASVLEHFCRQLAAFGVPLWRAFVGMRTLHPQWAGYTYTWWRHRDSVEPTRRERGEEYDQDLKDSPFLYLLSAADSREPPFRLRRRLAEGGVHGDLPILAELAAAGATDYFAELIPVGMVTEAFPDSGIGFSFATDHPDGFSDEDLRLIDAVLPAVSLTIISDAEHTIAAGLLAAYLGSDVGRRVHAGVVERGSVESIQAVLWYADIRGFTPIADAAPGRAVVEMLNETFETLTAPLRLHGGEVLKFLGDGMLASFAFTPSTRNETCVHAFAAAAEAMRGLDLLAADRTRMGKVVARVDLALHLGEVLYGNIGAMDRLDFTVIGPAVNEVARIETLCEPLGHRVLVSAELASVAGRGIALESLGMHLLRGVREPKEIFALRL
jgi:adenylate cyclase